ncbi:metallophosphoesterase [Luteolibacter sp. LG18]|uniref:metallophosphoesterase n=1 Tax=Luteolibacter sp. LG18 TaxID=2819286 RepID=UPI002B2DE8E3|nr:phosphatase [Luteolibacter sp. LG18]
MRIRILSDLHQEFGLTEIPRTEADLIVLAGDISTKLNALPWIREFCGTTPAAYLCGNHEYYGDQLPKIADKIRAALVGSNIRFLENDHFDLHGWHIYGCTLWTDMALLGPWEAGAAEAGEWMNDYKRIRNSANHHRKLTPRDTRLIHQRSLERMGEFLSNHDPAKTIVVTHHAPSILSLPEVKRTNPLSCAYASDLTAFIERHQPRLWIHGHIHKSADYHIGRTRIVSNPQGYPDDPNPGFKPDWVLDLDSV